MNFIFESQTNDSVYVGTAGHCVKRGEAMRTAQGETFGEAVYVNETFDPDLGLQIDFALVEIEEDWRDRVDPHLRVWGGPRDVGELETGDAVFGYGNGKGFEATEPTRPRVGFVVDEQFEDSQLFAALFAPFYGGDSGSPMVDQNGDAAAILQGGATNVDTTAAGVPVSAIHDVLDRDGWNVQLVTVDEFEPILHPDRPKRMVEHCRESPTGLDGCARLLTRRPGQADPEASCAFGRSPPPLDLHCRVSGIPFTHDYRCQWEVGLFYSTGPTCNRVPPHEA
jgi:hypothetical protein